MEILKNLKLDRWYMIVLYLGVLLVTASLIFTIEFMENKHLFGFGIGLTLVGISMKMTERIITQFNGQGYFSIPDNKHNPLSIILMVIGISLTLLFGYIVIKGLI